MRVTSFRIMGLLSIGVAAYAIAVYGLLPLGAFVHPDIRPAFLAHPGGIYLHVFGAAVALALGPFQFSSRLRRDHPTFHRWSGRFYLGAGVLIGGLAGLYMAMHAYGGGVSRIGFAALALAWLYTGVRAYLAIRAGDVVTHRAWMVRNFALAFAAVTLRLYLPPSMIAGIPFELAYPVIAWLCWVPNLVVAEWLLTRNAHRPAD